MHFGQCRGVGEVVKVRMRDQDQIDLAQQSAYLVQATALGLAAGVERIAVYKFYDWNLPPSDETFGLIRADQSRRPAFDTWAMVIRHLNGVKSAAYTHTDDVGVVKLTYIDGRHSVVAWAKTEKFVKIEISAGDGTAILIDQYGTELPLLGANFGWYEITLNGARCNEIDKCPVGGNIKLISFDYPQDNPMVRVDSSSGTINLEFE